VDVTGDQVVEVRLNRRGFGKRARKKVQKV
jgi:hypothetical protein